MATLMMRPVLRGWRAGMVFALLASILVFGEFSSHRIASAQGPVLDPTSGHWYKAVAVPAGIEWFEADAAARGSTFMEMPGHLVTITSAAENDFIATNFPGAISPVGYWLGAFQPAGSAEPGGGWRWVTGEPFVFQNWGLGEPNNSEGHEDGLQFSKSDAGRWNDAPRSAGVPGHFPITGYVVEYEPAQSVLFRWTELAPIGGPPQAVADSSGAFDPSTRNWYVFGGHNGSTEIADFWKYSVADNAWTRLTPTGGPPPRRGAHAAVWDDLKDRMLVFGGNPCFGASGCRSDLWAYYPTTDSWTLLTSPPPTPGGRAGATAIWDPVRKRMMLYGGGDGVVCCTGDLWAFDSAAELWHELAPGPGRGNHHHAAVWDDDNDKMVTFGGNDSTDFNNDLWTYDPVSDTWDEVESSSDGLGRPSRRGDATAVWDAPRNRILFFAGYGGLEIGNFNDTWSYSPTSGLWEKLIPIGGPPGTRRHHIAAWDSAGDQMLVFGGEGSRLNDLWSLSAELVSCGGFVATIVGTPGDDQLYGTPGPDVIVGLGGDDEIDGKGGNDIICGGEGDDMLKGRDGDDKLLGQEGNDRHYGGDGNDTIIGGPGVDVVYGGNGDDWIAGGEGDDRLRGQAGNDILVGGPGDDMLKGSGGNDIGDGGPGKDRFYGGSGNDTFDGGPDRDVAYGDDGDDHLVGGTGPDKLKGYGGNDICDGSVDGDVDVASSSCETKLNIP